MLRIRFRFITFIYKERAFRNIFGLYRNYIVVESTYLFVLRVATLGVDVPKLNQVSNSGFAPTSFRQKSDLVFDSVSLFS